MTEDSAKPAPYDPTSPPESWFHLGWFFDGILIHSIHPPLPKSDVLSIFESSDSGSERLIEVLKEAEKPHLPEIEAAVCLMSNSGEVDLNGFSPEARRLINTRAETVAGYIRTFFVGDESPFPLPQCSMGVCIKWLMIDWWEAHGRQMAVDVVVSDRSNDN